MESLQQDLVAEFFADPRPSLDLIGQVCVIVHSSQASQLRFTEQLDQQRGKAKPNILPLGIGLYMIGQYQQAVSALEQAQDCPQKYLYLAYALRGCREYEKAIKALEMAGSSGADGLLVAMEKVATYRLAKDYAAAQRELDLCANYCNVSAEYHYQKGRLEEDQGLYEQAMEDYRIAIGLAPDHQGALFHLAYRSDLAGDDQTAIELYSRIASGSHVSTNALLNLAVLYEDAGEYDKALECVERVLQAFPNHQRAQLFKKDIVSSKTMYFDEEQQRQQSQKNAILETPISDFELSVRSRNCLKKMNIRTIGDLLKVTEAELLSFKNFGETSLKEVKAILESKGLRLGMALEEGQEFTQLPQEPSPTPPPPEDTGVLGKSVEELQLSVRARKALQRLNIKTIGQLTRTTEAELLGCKNFGATSLNEVKRELANLGLSLKSLD